MASGQNYGEQQPRRHQVIYSSNIEDDEDVATPVQTLFTLPSQESPVSPTCVGPAHVHALCLSLSLPPLLSDRIIATSPIVGTREEWTTKACAKGQHKQTVTIANQQADEEAQKAHLIEESQCKAEESEEAKRWALNNTLSSLTLHGLNW